MTPNVPPDERGVTAGFASRTTAMLIDVVVIATTFYGGLALVSLTVQVLRVHRLDPGAVPARITPVLLTGWTVLYFWIGWWVFAKTLGKALVGLRVVRTDGGTVGWSRALVRVAGYGLSALALGAGFAWVAMDTERRGWHDRLAGTRVIYDWRMHSAPLEHGEREHESPRRAAGSSDGGDDLRPTGHRCSTDVGRGQSRSTCPAPSTRFV